MSKNEKNKGEKESEAEIGLGNLSFGGLFKGIEKIIDLAAELNKAGGEIKKEGEIDFGHLKKGMKGVFGFSIKSASSGNPVVEPFGNIKKSPQGPKVEEEREPIFDLFDEKEEVHVYVEMPGVNEGDIHVELKGDILEISAQSKERKYRKEILLPKNVLKDESGRRGDLPVKFDTLTSSYKNGILEVRVKKL